MNGGDGGGGGGGVVKNDSDTHKTVLVIGEKDDWAESIVSQKEGNGLVIIYLNTVSVSLFSFFQTLPGQNYVQISSVALEKAHTHTHTQVGLCKRFLFSSPSGWWKGVGWGDR